MHIDMLTKLLDATTPTLHQNCAANATDLLSDPSVIALAATSTSSWTGSPSISPMALKLESPLLSPSPGPSSETPAKPKGKSKAVSSSSTTHRKRSTDPADKETKARERVLRNRAAAQESRDKKRKYVEEIETSNEHLQQENTQLLKRLKTVESDNLALSQRLETLTAQFAQMQQLLSQSLKHNQPGVGFCQSAVLAKKDKRSRKTDALTNSPQQKLAPPKRNLYTTTSTAPMPNKHRRVYSMTMKTLMSKRDQNREARSSDPSAAQNWMETSCRPYCYNSRNMTLTLSSSAAVSFLTTRPPARQLATTALMMVLLTTILPQLMLNFSTLFLTSTGARSSHPQELQLQQAALSFIRQLSLSRQSNDRTGPLPRPPAPHSRTIKDNISSLHPLVIQEIVTEFRQGRRDVARGLLVKALLSSRLTLDNDGIKGLAAFSKK
ncbi:hypothetical protein BGZ54_004315 [Gamsiella multidivaricata]|nr:hypothetical protein BGZ54_004315 [Gamsiella multidivaricata]